MELGEPVPGEPRARLDLGEERLLAEQSFDRQSHGGGGCLPFAISILGWGTRSFAHFVILFPLGSRTGVICPRGESR